MNPVTIPITSPVCRLLSGPLALVLPALWMRGGSYPPPTGTQTRLVWLDAAGNETSWMFAEFLRLEVVA